jgi:fucose permease
MTGHELIPVTIASAFTFGMVLALLGSLKLPLAKRLDIDEARVGGFLSAFYLALIPLMLISGLLIDQVGIRWVLVGGVMVTGLAVAYLAMSRTYASSLAAVLFLGVGGACLNTSAIKLMPLAFFGDANPSASLNLGHVFVGLGALVTPTLVDLLIRGLGFRKALGVLALGFLIPFVVGFLTPAQAFAFRHAEAGDLWFVLSNPIVWLAGLVFLLYSPLEGCLGTWATTFLTQLGHSERRAAFLLSGFWLSFLASRLVMSFVQHTMLRENTEPWVILVLAVVAAVVLGNLAGTLARANATRGLLVVGALLGPICPTLAGILFNKFDREQATAYGAMFALGASGNLVLAPLIGMYARGHSIQSALRIPMMMALLLAAGALALGLMLTSLLF